MKLALIYDPECPKLTENAYSQTYRDMFLALCERYEQVQHVTESCSATDIEADHVIFFDIHSSHDITIDGIEKHRAVKFEYFNDPYQMDSEGKYQNGTPFKKLGPEKRARRANARGVQYVICPYINQYHTYIAPFFDGELIWFPVAPKPRLEAVPKLADRRLEVLANGHVWKGTYGFRPYHFRDWAFSRPGVTLVDHAIHKGAPEGDDYQSFLSQYVGALALSDTHCVPKYLEIPLSGCVTVAQYLYQYEMMGFRDGESCIYVTKKNFDEVVRAVKRRIGFYQPIADKGRETALNWTAEKFAERIHETGNHT
jgi:hypothetical protein